MMAVSEISKIELIRTTHTRVDTRFSVTVKVEVSIPIVATVDRYHINVR